jgi:hypothetical protein
LKIKLLALYDYVYVYGYVYSYVYGYDHDYNHVYIYGYNGPLNPSRPFKPYRHV